MPGSIVSVKPSSTTMSPIIWISPRHVSFHCIRPCVVWFTIRVGGGVVILPGLVVSVVGDGISTGSVAVEGVDAPLPTTFILRQNYPNPFNPLTRIEFTVGISNALGSTEHVTLDVFNVLGQKVATLMDDFLQAGEYFHDWDATDRNGQRVASGVYLYRLKVGDEQQTKKMLLLK